MLIYLQQFESYFGPFRLFQFISVRSILAGITALLIGFIIGPKLIRFLENFGAKQAFRDKDEVGEIANLHEGKAKTPTMGGLLIFLSVVISSLLWADLNVYVVAALVTYGLLTVVGFTDDFSKNQQKTVRVWLVNTNSWGQLITTAVVLFILLGPLSETLTGIMKNPTGSEIKMRELWVPFFKDPILIGMPIILVFLFFLGYLDRVK